LGAGRFVRVVVEQKTIDIALRLEDPNGQLITAMDNWTGGEPERLSWVAEADGAYVLRVAASRTAESPGAYGIQMESPRAATARDLRMINAERTVAGAVLALREPAAETLRQAVSMFEAALIQWRELGDGYGQAQAHSYLAGALLSLRRYREAVDHELQALPLWRSLGNRFLEALSINEMADAYHGLGELQRAEEQYSLSLGVWRSLGNRPAELRALTALGALHAERGAAAEAIGFYQQALAVANSTGGRSQQADLLADIGLAYEMLNDSLQAILHLRQALEIRQAMDDIPGHASALTGLGTVYETLGDTDTAVDYYQQALQLWVRASNLQGEAQALNNLGAAYYVQGERETALEHFDRAVQLWRRLGERAEETRSLRNMGLVHLYIDDRAALDYFQKALQAEERTEETTTDAWALLMMALAHDHLGNSREALDLNNRALALSQAGGNRKDEMWALFGRALVYSNISLATALTEIEKAIAIFESMGSGVASQELRATFFSRHMSLYKVHANILMRLHQSDPTRGYAALAIQASENARARSLLETLGEVRGNILQGANPVLVERERDLELRIEALETQRVRMAASPEAKAPAAWEQELGELLRQKQELLAQMRSSSPHYATLLRPAPLNLPEIQQLLDEDTLLLEISLGEQQSYLWAVRRDSLNSFVLPGELEIRRLAGRTYAALTVRNQSIPRETAAQRQARLAAGDAEYAEAAKALSNELLGPVASYLGNNRLVIVGDGVLQYIPFGALPEPARPDSQPLAIRHEIVSLPSASVLAVLRQFDAERKPAAKTVAVLADPVFQENDPRLRQRTPNTSAGSSSAPGAGQASGAPSILRQAEQTRFQRLRFTRQEADAIAALVSPDQRFQALDFAASRETALSAELSQFRVLHFATHAVLDNVSPSLSGIVLSLVNERGEPRNGFLRLHEIYNLNLNADLVVLSACQTALGREIRGEGLVGLTRGFMYAGSPRVIASLWPVDDRATAELMKGFYRRFLREGLTPAASLRAAQLDMMKAPRWRSPYYWAGFVLQGDWR
jgi:CHAT domain-containing protein/Tfp pilus assembly protein PilF